MEINNNLSKVSDLSIARALTWRYVIALALVASLSTAAWLSLHLVISEQQSTAAVVNVSGRQRMLSQRTALFANLLVNAPKTERVIIHEKLKDAIQLMEQSHHGLIHGDSTMGLPGTLSPTVRAMYFDAPNGLDAQVETYIKAVNALLLLDEDALIRDNPLLQYITKTASTTLVVALNQMVQQYQLEGEASVNRLQKAETIFWGLTLLLLILEAGLIFHPFVRHVRSIISKLRSVTDELEFHQGQLEETIKERTAALENKSKELAESEEKFRLISTAAHDAIVIVGTEGQVTYWNPAAEKIFGYTANHTVGKNLHVLLAPVKYHNAAHTGLDRFQDYGADNFTGKTFETTALHENGKEFPIELSISAVQMQNSWHALGIIRDITERKQMEEKVHQLAFYDALTNLPNRRLFNDRLNQAIAAGKRSGCYGALMFLDLDNFKPLNDIHGHGMGDLLLIEAGSRLESAVRKTDTIARVGGDEFVVMLSELSTSKTESALQASHVAEKILVALSEPYILTDTQEGKADISVEHRCTASIGIALFLDLEESPDQIMKCADAAMYQAKGAGRNSIRFYDSIN